MMLVSLFKLKGFIQTYAGYNFDRISGPELEELKNFAGQALSELRREMAGNLDNLHEETEKAESIYHLQSQLTYMADSLSGFDRENKPEKEIAPIFRWLQNGLFDLLDHMRVYFTAYFDFKMDLPAGFAGTVKPVYQCFDAVKDKLGRSPVDPGLSALIIHFSAATDKSERFRVRTWHQWDFLVKTIGAIDHFLNDPPQGDINLALLKLFVCMQFNSIQVFYPQNAMH